VGVATPLARVSGRAAVAGDGAVTRPEGARGRNGGVAAATGNSGTGEGPVGKVPIPHGGEGGTAGAWQGWLRGYKLSDGAVGPTDPSATSPIHEILFIPALALPLASLSSVNPPHDSRRAHPARSGGRSSGPRRRILSACSDEANLVVQQSRTPQQPPPRPPAVAD